MTRHEELVARLNAICDEQSFITSWHFRNLLTGDRANRAGSVPTPSASTRKIAYLMAALREVHAGRMDLAEPVVITEELQKGVVSGVMYFMTPGLVFPMRDALVQMIITSDNTCTSIVGDRITVAGLNAFCASAGMTGTLIRHVVPPRDLPVDANFDFVAQTTPDDQAHLLQAILDGSMQPAAAERLGVTPELCRMALEILGWQRYRNAIPGLLPGDARVANKTGTGRNGQMDAGIVYRDGKPLFILAAYTHEVPQVLPGGMPGHAISNQTIARLARACWDGT
jgi:beta-lactamase class A